MTARPPARHVALMVETSNAYARGVLAGIHDYVRQRPQWSLYLAEHSRHETDFSWLEGWRGDGILARMENQASASFVRSLGLPAVDLSAKRYAPEFPCVETDDAEIARRAIDHFAERGLRQFAFCGDARFGWSVARGQAFAELVRERGARPHEFALKASRTRIRERRRLAAWLRELPRPVGVLACYDIAGQEVLESCALGGLRVPDEVAVLGVDNDELYCNLTTPPLSSIQPDTRRTGFLAAELLDAMMAGADEPPGLRAIPPLRITTRQSSDMVAVDDPVVAAALRYIRDHAEHAVRVDAVLGVAGLSRRALDLRFNSWIGHSVHTEIVRVRMDRVAASLTTTDLSLQQIAQRLEFPHAEYMAVAFKRHTGQSPGEFRRRASPGRSG